MSIDELKSSLLNYQDKANRSAITAARLLELTYNMNRASSSDPALEDIAPYLPYPYQYLTSMQLAKVDDISLEACIDFANYYDKLPAKIKIFFDDFAIGLKTKAQNG